LQLAGPAIFAAIPFAGARADPPAYAALAGQSSVTFSGTQQGEKFTGTFREFDAHVVFAPNQLAASKITATIKMKSLSSKSPDRDAALAAPEWFDYAKYPVASFRTDSIRMTPSGLVADAELTIKATTRRIQFPFALKAESGRGVLEATVTLDRLDFGVGAGEWADESVAGRNVDVTVHLALTEVPGSASAKH
jgi:cytochrome b561